MPGVCQNLVPKRNIHRESMKSFIMISIILNIGVYTYIYKLNQSYWYIEPSYWIYWTFQWSQLLKWFEIHQVERNLLPIIWNLPPTVPPTAPPHTPCRQEALLALCQQQGFDAVSLVTCVGSLQKAKKNGREGLRNEARVTERSRGEYMYIYIYRHITHGESWRRKVFWCIKWLLAV